MLFQGGAPLVAQVLTPDKIVEKVQASTVLVEDLEGSGSGVVLTNTGLILTNLHVIGSGIDLKVKLNMRFGNKLAVTELDKVKLLKVHPKYDLAVLQATAPEGASFVPVEVVPKLEKVVTGTKCFVIGNPGGPDGKVLEMSITEGLVSSASRTLEDLQYLQISAAMNPGNSGGPVCDERGRCIGIATLKMAQTEGIGFAIPMQAVNLPEFIDRKDRPNDVALARELEHYARQFLEAARLSSGDEQRLLWLNAIQFYRLSLAAAPNDPSPFNNLGVVYGDMGNKAMAKKYYEAAIGINPINAASLHSLGVILINEGAANEPRCQEMWLKGLEDKGDLGAAAICAEDLAILAQNRRQFHAVAYMLRWSSILEPQPPSFALQKRMRLWQAAEAEIGAEDAGSLRVYAGPFSRETFEKLLKGEPYAALKAKMATATPAGPAGTPAPAGAPGAFTLEQMRDVAAKATAKFSPAKQVIPAEGLDLPLPDVVRNPILANSGWQLVLPFKNLGKVGVFNLATCKFDGYIDCTDANAMCASGGHVLALYLPGTKTLELYDLNTLQRKSAQVLNLKTHVAYIGMGLLNPMQLFAICESVESNGFSNYVPAIIRLPGLEPYYPPLIEQNAKTAFSPSDKGALLEGAVDESGGTCAVRRLHVSPSGYAVYSLSGDGTVRWSTEHMQVSHPRPSFFASAVVDRQHVLLGLEIRNSLDKQPLPFRDDFVLAPIAGYAGIVARVPGEKGRFHVFGLPQRNSLAEIPGGAAAKERGDRWDADEAPFVTASVYSDRLVSIIPKSKRLHLLNLGLAGASSEDVAQPGKLFQRKVKIAPGATAALESGPKGLTFDAASGSISWQVPADAPTGQTVQVLLLVKGADGKEDYQIEKILVP